MLAVVVICVFAAVNITYMVLNAGRIVEEIAQPTTAVDQQSLVEAPVVLDSDAFELVGGTVYLYNDHSAHVYVVAELKNVTQEMLSPEFSVVLYNAKGKKIEEEKYVSSAPGIVPPGESVFIKEWIYDFAKDAHSAVRAEIVCRSEVSRYRHAERWTDAEAAFEGNAMTVTVKNPGTEPVYGLEMVGVLRDAQGRMIDMFHDQLSSSMGVSAGGGIVCRRDAAQYLHREDLEGAACEAYVYTNAMR